MSKRTLLLFGFILLKFGIHFFLISPEYDLQRDEYLHLDQANHLAWGYLSVPPFTSWVAFSIKLLGNGIFWIKFFPALFGALTIVVVWKAIEELGGNTYALILGAISVMFSALFRLNTLFQPNSFDVLSWTCFYFFLLKYFNSNSPRLLYAAAIVFALGFLNKYNILFSVMGLLPAIMLTRQRKILFQKELYIAIGIAFILVLPNLVWQYNNSFPVLHHMKELADTQLVNVDRLGFLKSQLLFFAGSLVVIIAGVIALITYKPFENYKSFFWSIIFTLLVFIYFKAKDYYAIGLYPVYIAFGSVFLANQLQSGWKRFLKPVLVLLPLLFFMMMYQIAFPNKSPEYFVQHGEKFRDLGLLRWEDGKDHTLPQDFADMVGWKELAEKVDAVFDSLPDPDQTLILCDNYGQAGAINYYTKHKNLVAHSFNADYIHWLDYDLLMNDVVLVKESGDDDKERKTERAFFDTVYLAAKRINQHAREEGIFIYVLKGSKIDVAARIRAEAEKKKSEWKED